LRHVELHRLDELRLLWRDRDRLPLEIARKNGGLAMLRMRLLPDRGERLDLVGVYAFGYGQHT
jgi:hypothetical protein